MNFKKLITIILAIVIGVFIQTLIPVILFLGYEFKPDVFLIILAYVALNHGRFPAIIVGFLLGLFQDFTTQVNLLGIFAFVKSVSGFTLGTIYAYKDIWTKTIKILIITLCFLLHYSIYYFVLINGTGASISTGIALVLTHTVVNTIILLVVDWFFIDFSLRRQ